MAEIGILKIDHSKRVRTVGRNPIYYKINKKFGIVIVIDLISSVFEICDLLGNTYLCSDIEVGGSFDQGHMYCEEDFVFIINKIKSLLKTDVLKDLFLRAICIATFGKVNVESGEYVWITNIDKDLNLKKMFEDEFKAPTIVFNDINLAAIAEGEIGKLKNKKENSLYISVGEGTANALFIDNRIVLGKDYQSGEIGYCICYSEFFKKTMRISELVTLHSLAKNAREYIRKNPTINTLLTPDTQILDIIKAYQEDDDLCKQLVFDSARSLGIVILNLLNVLDCEAIVLGGDIVNFGEEYLQIINETISINSHNLQCQFSAIKNSVMQGAKIMVADLAIKSNLRTIDKK